MTERMKKALFAVAAIAALALGGSALANAASSNSGATGGTGASGQTPKQAPPNMASHTSINPDEHLLTGETAAKVKAAATAKVKGTVDRVETDDGGVYEAHITKSDGTHVEVKVNKQFEVTAVSTMNGPGGDHDGDRPGAPGGY
ncbi:MAG: hypothetical protein ACRDKI_08115 [Solirubrobacterales bacterium]